MTCAKRIKVCLTHVQLNRVSLKRAMHFGHQKSNVQACRPDPFDSFFFFRILQGQMMIYGFAPEVNFGRLGQNLQSMPLYNVVVIKFVIDYKDLLTGLFYDVGIFVIIL